MIKIKSTHTGLIGIFGIMLVAAVTLMVFMPSYADYAKLDAPGNEEYSSDINITVDRVPQAGDTAETYKNCMHFNTDLQYNNSESLDSSEKPISGDVCQIEFLDENLTALDLKTGALETNKTYYVQIFFETISGIKFQIIDGAYPGKASFDKYISQLNVPDWFTNVLYNTENPNGGHSILRTTKTGVRLSEKLAVYGTFTTTSTKTITGITADTSKTKTEYAVGEAFDPTGLIVYKNFSDGTKQELNSTEYTYSPTTAFTTAGDQEITITYSESAIADFTTSFNVTVKESGLSSGTSDVGTSATPTSSASTIDSTPFTLAIFFVISSLCVAIVARKKTF